MRETVRGEPNNARSAGQATRSSEGRFPWWAGYVLTFLIEFVLTGLLYIMHLVFPGVLVLTPYILVTMGIAYYFGPGPALLSVLLTMIGQTYVYVPSLHALWPFGRTAAELARFWFLIVAMVVAAGAMVSVRRLTERLRAEAAIREQALDALEAERARLKTTLDVLPVGVAIVDRDGAIVEVNGAYRRIVSGGSPVGANTPIPERPKMWRAGTDEVIGPEDWPSARIFRTGAPVFDERMDIERLDGNRATLLVSAVPIRDEQGRLTDAVIAVQDITELDRLRKDLEHDRERLSALYGIAEIGTSTMSMDEALSIVAARIREIMRADSCAIFILEEESQRFVARTASNMPGLVGLALGVSEGLAGIIYRERRPVCIQDAEHDPRVSDEVIRKEKIKTLLSVPLIARAQLIGWVGVATAEPREFSDDEVNLMEAMASRAALIIENARLAEETKHNFELLQRALLPPKPPEVPGCWIASAYIPGVRGLEIGGDFFDVFLTEAGHVAAIIGDVAGKGVPSAALAADTRSTVRAFAYDTSSPGESLTHANAVISGENSDETLFVTVLLAVIDRAAGVIRYANAGHPPAAIYHGDTAEVEFVEFGDPPVAVIGDRVFSQWERPVKAGDRIVFYTDGLSEAGRDALMFGQEGIERVLREHGAKCARELLDELVSAASTRAHGRMEDDTAVIVLECVGEHE